MRGNLDSIIAGWFWPMNARLCERSRAWWVLLLFALCGNRLHSGLNLLRIAEIVAPNRLQLGIEFVHQRHARGYVQLDDRFFRHVVQVLDQRSQAVSVRGDQYLLARLHFRSDAFMPVREEAG